MHYLILIMMMLSSAFASDWLMIQGTEPDFIKNENEKIRNTLSTPRFWGFAQFKYEKNYSDIVESSGVNKSGFAYVAPTLKKQEQFQLYRARLGLRGVVDDENKINYFTLSEWGENGITNPLGYSQDTCITDASLTLRHIPYANIRFGLFKYPGSEEGLQARFVSSYIHFTQMSNYLLLEKAPKSDMSLLNSNGTFTGEPANSTGAFRDTGIELFDRVQFDEDWAFSYALMLGNGSGLEWRNINSQKYTGYGYMAFERSFHKGKGYNAEDFKSYVWYQEGKRSLEANHQTHSYTRLRYGAGLRYFKDGLRLEAEYTGAKGMLFSGIKDVNPTVGSEEWHFSVEADENNRAYGYYLSAMYEFYPKAEVMIRYDELDNLKNSLSKERIFKTTTLGFSYHFQGPTRLDLNYLFRRAKAPGDTTAQSLLEKIDDIVSLQFTYKFSMQL